jgi:hypothetical protein
MSTVFVTLSDVGYYPKAIRTIQELREYGNWDGDVVLIAVDFDPNPTELYNATIYKTSHIDTDGLMESFRNHPIKPMPDNRHFAKLYQWDKLQVFKPFFRQWDRVVFLDAGIRIFDSVDPLLNLDWKGHFLAPDDSEPYDNGHRFRIQLDVDANPPAREAMFSEFPDTILDSKYFNNCMFVFDTRLTYQTTFEEMEEYMNKFPIFMCNEMGLMNLIFHFKLGVWKSFPQITFEGKYLFGWSEMNYRENPSWDRFHFIKYSLCAPAKLEKDTIQSRYVELCNTWSDIVEHLPTLASYAAVCSHITECGVRGAVSSYALAVSLLGRSNVKLVQVDIFDSPNAERFRSECKQHKIPSVFHRESDLICPMEETDMLFIDTWHVYGHMKRELTRWNPCVRKYILLHDTEVDKWRGEVLRCGGNVDELSKESGIPKEEITRGIWPAVREFLKDHPEWRLEEQYTNCNGLTVLARVPSPFVHSVAETKA